MPHAFVSDEEIAAIGAGLIARTLPKPEWTHAAHFAAALWLMRRRADISVERAMPAYIRAYNEATGVPNTESSGYHETITLASLRGARALLARFAPDEPLHLICSALLASPLGRSDWLLDYWSKALLFSPEARRVWVAPDLQPLPF
jgi:hypothetical protein